MTLTDLMITSVFTGMGTATGLTLFEYFIKPRLKRVHKKVKRILT